MISVLLKNCRGEYPASGSVPPDSVFLQYIAFFMQKENQKPFPALYPKNWEDYQLLDSGNFRKLEKFGEVLTDRPEPSADWPKSFSKEKWSAADLYFHEEKGQKGQWKERKKVEKWNINYKLDGHKNIRLLLEKTAFKHIGIFPEQAVNWEYIYRHCKRIAESGTVPKVLNLFAYTGASSIAAGAAGAEVTHVDSMKQAVQWAKENAAENDLENIRWIIDDARKFVKRSIARGEKYQGVILDPPAFGVGGKGELWKLEKHLPPLLADILQLMDRRNSFFVMNLYSPSFDHIKLKKLIAEQRSFPKLHELKTLGVKSKSDKILPLGNLLRFYS